MNTEKMLMDNNFDINSMDELAELKRRADVVQAFLDGKRIQVHYRTTPGNWCRSDQPKWDWGCFDYRVEPELIEGWVNVYTWGLSTLHESKEIAARDRDQSQSFLRLAYVREVEE